MDGNIVSSREDGPSPPHASSSVDEKLASVKPDMLPHWDSTDICAAPGNATHLVRRKRRKDETLSGILRSWVEHHQIGICMNLLSLLALTHICFPRARRHTRNFFELSYYDASTGRYTQGIDDIFFVAYWITIFTGLRAAVMTYILLPFAQWAGLERTKPKVRFSEQAWLLLYYIVFWTLGMYIMYNSKYWLSLRELWTDFPSRSMGGLQKWYYLVQFAFWLQQILVVNIEERRKDHWQMFTHHIVTSALIFTSYGFYQTRVGNVILCVMDVVDLVLPAAKMLKYTGYQRACDIAFGIFIFTWVAARHVLYLMVCWSIYVDVPEVMPFGCYSSVTGERFTFDGGENILAEVLQPFLNPGGPVCFNQRIRVAFLSLLLFLQGITLVWFSMICRVAYKVLKGNPADDSRSDDEESEEEEQQAGEFADEEEPVVVHTNTSATANGNKQPVERLVGVESLNLKNRASPRYRNRKAGTHTSGLSIASHSDRKELLGRIGCDKPS